MLLKLGYGISPIFSPLDSNQIFLFTSSLHSDFSYTRNDSVATYRNSNGELQSSSVDSPRFNHDATGKALGLLMEGQATNLCTNHNHAPTNLTNMTTGGDTNGVLSIINDSSELASAGLDQGNNNVFKADASLCSTSFSIYVTGNVANISDPHSISVYARGTGVGSRTGRLVLTGSDTMDIAPPDNGYEHFALEGIIPDSTSRRFRIDVDAGDIVYFKYNQLEQFERTTSTIITAGASALRKQDQLILSNLDQKEYFNYSAGAIVAFVNFQNTSQSITQYPFSISDGSSSNIRSIRLYSDGFFRGFNYGSGNGNHSLSNYERPEIKKLYPIALSWDSSETIIASGGITRRSNQITSQPIGINRLEIGSRNGGLDPLYGHISKLEIHKSHQTIKQLGNRMIKSEDQVFIFAGQSNASGYFSSPVENSDAGRMELISNANNYWENGFTFIIEGATGSAPALKDSAPTEDWYYDDNTDTYGAAYEEWEEIALGCNRQIEAIIWDQGESDATALYNSTITEARYKGAIESIFSKMREKIGNVPVFIIPIGRRGSSATDIQTVREVQQELATEYSWIHLTPEKFDNNLADDLHMDKDGYANQATRITRKIADSFGLSVTGGVNGAEINNASRSGTNITVNISHDNGNDFTPASNIEGFYFTDDSVEISITSAIRTNATTITLTLASTPTGTEILYYGHNTMSNVTASNLVMDNDSISLPLRSSKVCF